MPAGLTKLPENFGNLIALQSLNIGGNKLKSLPKSFSNLISLKILELDEEQIKYLPDSYRNLKSLQILSGGGNNFNFPKELKNWKKQKSRHQDKKNTRE